MSESFENLLSLMRSPSILSHLQDLKLDGRGKKVCFQWLGPHFLTFLRYVTNQLWRYEWNYERFGYLLKGLYYSASDCILYGETEHYQKFLEIILPFMPHIRGLFRVPKHTTDRSFGEVLKIFIDFLLEIIEELLNRGTDSCVIVSKRIKVLQQELKFLLTFLLDTTVFESNQSTNAVRNHNILTEIKAVSSEAGLFFHSFFFTTDPVTTTKMDQELSDLLQRTDIVKVKIKDHCITVSKKLNRGIGSLQGAESTSEASSSIPMVEEIVVGFEDVTTQIASKLLGGPNYRQIISIVGMSGLGKTTLAKKIYNNSNVRHHFDMLSWCVVSQFYKKRNLLIDLLCSANNLTREKILEMEDEYLKEHFPAINLPRETILDLKEHFLANSLTREKIWETKDEYLKEHFHASNLPRDKILEMDDDRWGEHLYKSLRGRRYLIIMDDLWDKNVLDDLKRFFPDVNDGSRLIFTSRLKNVALEPSHIMIEPPPLSLGECWDLLEKKVFKKNHCPQELQDIGKQIASNCRGIPLSVVTIAGVLSNMEKERSIWQEVAKRLSSYISQKADDYIPILKLSYIHLPSHLKKCFLYLCAFEEDEKIPVWKLLSLWIAEGFIEKTEQKSLEDVAEEYLMELIDRSLLQIAERSSNKGVKTCTLHDLILDMCYKIAVEENFLFEHQFLISMQRHRFYTDQSHDLSVAISIIYDLEKIRIFNLKYDVNDLPRIKIMPELRYLEISSLQSSMARYMEISSLQTSTGRLQNLEVLHAKWGYDIPTYLLNMPKLRHLQVGSPKRAAVLDNNCNSSQINSLQTLSFIYIFDSKDEEILKCSPNLRRLKCISPHKRCPDLNFLSKLESLKLEYTQSFKGSVVNIKKLTLCKMGLLWEEMSLIGTLPNLEILKLEQDAFEGETWETKDDEFQKLKFLKLDSLQLEHWNSSSDHFPVLERLVLRDCSNLEMIPSEFSNIPTLQKIELYYSHKVEESALGIQEEQKDYGNEEFEVIIAPLYQ